MRIDQWIRCCDRKKQASISEILLERSNGYSKAWLIFTRKVGGVLFNAFIGLLKEKKADILIFVISS